MAVGLSKPTIDRVDDVFPGADRKLVRQLLEQDCADTLPSWRKATPSGLERIRFAVLKLSGGTLDGLRTAIGQAHTDWRDVLVAAGFADAVDAHLAWRPRSDD